ncbi:hypothetical protein FSP39_022771 [Pinctada imbricata]|uniref:Uncharacterized protein n=1 Tax=Pinctada imbricata TaxID=66713 RepID=A0AA88XDP7_PINIB|nr:hypothetical protein FSP39_022771 [Pinctada imbricata]
MDICDRMGLLFGTEEHVRMRRGLVLLREDIFNYNSDNPNRIICSGSLGEGVAYPTSDDDLMMYFTKIRVVKSYREATQMYDLLMVPSEHTPGYCMLRYVNLPYPANMMFEMDEMPYFSSLSWKQSDQLEGESIHGPCRSQIIGDYEYDFAKSISCSFWPDVAQNWILRNRLHSWPSRELIQDIVMSGCHVVPIGDQSSSFYEHGWRISFSVAERTLMHSMNHVQFLTYNLLRLCLKRIIEKGSAGVLCSYFMKTTLFYTAENTPSQFWQAENIETCFKTCLSVLYDYVYHGYCPNYFIPEYNMIKRKVNHTNRQPLLDIVKALHGTGIVGIIHLCGESICLHEHMSFLTIEHKLDFEFLISNHFILTVRSLPVLTSKRDINDVFFGLFHILYHNSTCRMAKVLFHRGIILCCQTLIDRLLSQPRINKYSYPLHKTIGTLLRIGYRADVTTGKLTAATYMYLIGKTESALSYLRRLLSEYSPYVIDDARTEHTLEAYAEVMCGRGYTMDYKVRHAYAPNCILIPGVLNAFPPSLRILISTVSVGKVLFGSPTIYLDPLSYTYVLESLCYIRMQNSNALLKKSTRCLVHRIDDLKGEVIMMTKLCIGIIKYEQNNGQSACRWFSSAYIMKDIFHEIFSVSLSHSIMTYIACSLNRRFRTRKFKFSDCVMTS